jgi:dUTP pyrophosphatase
MPILKVKRLHPLAKIPSKANPSDSGLDICCIEDLNLLPNNPTMVSTGIALEIPEYYEIQVRGRSGLASKGIIPNNGIGTVDQNYRGEIKVILNNISRELVRLPAGSKIAQLVLQQVPQVIIEETQELDTNTDRSNKGFGSSGT